MQHKVGGKLHLKLNTGMRPIANKYREVKVKSTWVAILTDAGEKIQHLSNLEEHACVHA